LGVSVEGGGLVTRQYGGAVQLITVLTTAKLKPDSILEENPCEGCPQPCVSICPVKALTPDRDRVMKMDGKDRATRGAFAYSACSKCYVVCHPESFEKKGKEINLTADRRR